MAKAGPLPTVDRDALRIERERLRALAGKEQGLLEGILLHSPHGIIVCDAQGKLIMQNQAARRIWSGEAAADSIADWSKYRAFHPDGRPFAASDWPMARCLSERRTTEAEETHFQRFDDSHGTLLGSSAPILNADDEVVGALSIFADISHAKELERENAAAHTLAAFLASAGTVLLSSALDLHETLERVARLAVPEIADLCSIEIPDDDLLSIAHADPAKIALARELRRRYPPRPDEGVAQVLRSGKPTLHSEVTDAMLVAAAQDPAHLELLRSLSLRSVMIVPMIARGRTVGVISFVSTDPRHKFSGTDLEMALRLAQKSALAVENARLFRAEQQARSAATRTAERMSRLQAITADLAKAVTSQAVAQVVIDHSAAAIGASTAGIWVLDEGGAHAQLLRSWNYSERAVQRVQTIPLAGPAPIADAMRRRTPVFIGSQLEYERDYPVSAERIRNLDTGKMSSVACLPLLVGDELLGALAFVFPLGQALDEDDRTFLTVVAGHCAQSLHRARLFEAEQRARTLMALLYELVDAVSRAATLEEVFEPALRALEHAVGVSRSSILLFDAEGVMRFQAWHGLSDTYRNAAEGHSPWQRDVTHALPILIPDVEADPSLQPLWPVFAAESIRALAIVPLMHQQRLLGKFMLYSDHPRAFTNEQLATARSMAAQVANSVARKRSEAEIARLFAEAEAARSEAETASRMKDDFLAVVSHELRTPMSAILGWSAILGSERRNDAATLKKGLDVIERNGRAQMKIIEDILDVSRIITGKLVIDPRPVSLVTVISEALDVVRASALAREISLEFSPSDDPHTLVGDPERLRQIVWNLLSNAIKFTPRGGRVAVGVVRELNQLVITVSDSGKGIAPEFLPHVFERFRQADSSTTRSQAGLGLGLSIVRHLVELHGGHVQADSAGSDCGTTFTVTLPVRAIFADSFQRTDTGSFVVLPRPAPERGASRLLSGLRILVVDDERDAREMLEEALSAYGADVQTAASTRHALDALQVQPPDVLVSDIGMPNEDGYALMRRIRALPPPFARIPAIALTAYARAQERERAIAAGYDEHLPKPTDPDTLAKLIHHLCPHAG